jgi:hypothetical protein
MHYRFNAQRNLYNLIVSIVYENVCYLVLNNLKIISVENKLLNVLNIKAHSVENNGWKLEKLNCIF